MSPPGKCHREVFEAVSRRARGAIAKDQVVLKIQFYYLPTYDAFIIVSDSQHQSGMAQSHVTVLTTQ